MTSNHILYYKYDYKDSISIFIPIGIVDIRNRRAFSIRISYCNDNNLEKFRTISIPRYRPYHYHHLKFLLILITCINNNIMSIFEEQWKISYLQSIVQHIDRFIKIFISNQYDFYYNGFNNNDYVLNAYDYRHFEFLKQLSDSEIEKYFYLRTINGEYINCGFNKYYEPSLLCKSLSDKLIISSILKNLIRNIALSEHVENIKRLCEDFYKVNLIHIEMNNINQESMFLDHGIRENINYDNVNNEVNLNTVVNSNELVEPQSENTLINYDIDERNNDHQYIEIDEDSCAINSFNDNNNDNLHLYNPYSPIRCSLTESGVLIINQNRIEDTFIENSCVENDLNKLNKDYTQLVISKVNIKHREKLKKRNRLLKIKYHKLLRYSDDKKKRSSNFKKRKKLVKQLINIDIKLNI